MVLEILPRVARGVSSGVIWRVADFCGSNLKVHFQLPPRKRLIMLVGDSGTASPIAAANYGKLLATLFAPPPPTGYPVVLPSALE